MHCRNGYLALLHCRNISQHGVVELVVCYLLDRFGLWFVVTLGVTFLDKKRALSWVHASSFFAMRKPGTDQCPVRDDVTDRAP